MAPPRIAPTEVRNAEGCLLRFALDRSIPESERSLPSPGPFGYVGTVFHEVVEAARRGKAGDPIQRSLLEQIWKDHLAAAEVRAVANGDGAWLPLAESVSSLERSRLSAIRLAAAQQISGRRSGTGSGGGDTETWLSTRDGLVAGRVDAIDRRGERVVLQDYKSGEIVDSRGGIKKEYSIQMKLYAALYKEDRGSWPDSLELIDRRGVPCNVEYTQSEATELISRARALLEAARFRLSAGRGLTDESVTDLARPGSEACATCRHRPVCPRFLMHLAATGLVIHGESKFPQIDAIGVIDDAQVTGDDRLWLQLGHRSHVRRIQGLSRCGSFRDPTDGSPAPDPPDRGQVVAVFGAVPRRPVDGEVTHLVASRSVRAFRVAEDSNPAQLVRATVNAARAIPGARE
jgi:hypothetical protein